MVYDKILKGKYINLKYVTTDDAQFILTIRQNPEFTKYLPRLDITVEEQQAWIEKQQKREGDYYFTISRKTGEKIGLIRVYDIKGAEGETGSLACKGTVIETREARLLLDDFAFLTLGLKTLHNTVRKDNISSIKSSESFGVRWVGEKKDRNGFDSLVGVITFEQFKPYRDAIRSTLYNSNTKRSENQDISSLENDIKRVLSSNITSINFNTDKPLVDKRIIDSLGLITVVELLQNRYNCKIPFTSINAENFNSVHNMAALIASLGGENILERNDFEAVSLEPLRLDIYETEKTVVQRILENALVNPYDAAIIANDKETTYQELAGMIVSISRWLEDVGVDEGDCVAVQAIHDDVCIAVYYAVHLLGAKLVPVEKNASQKRINDIATDTQCKIIISIKKENGEFWHEYSEIQLISHELKFTGKTKIKYPDIDLPCEMIFTTGTTGKSKGVLMTHRHMSWYAYSVAKCIEMKEKNRFLLTTPLNHAGGLRRTHLSLANGCCMVYMDGLSDLGKYFNYMEKYKVTSLYLPPVAIRILLTRTKDELSRYREQIDFVYSSSSPLPMGDCEMLRALLPNTRLYNAYEASETPGVSAYNYNVDNALKNCLGMANAGIELAIMHEDGSIDTTPNVSGQICVKSKMNMKEYYMEDELTASVLKEGWFVSNDLGHMDNLGNIFYEGRKGDVINIGGYKIAPNDVEEVALASGMINECICIEGVDEFKVPYLKLLVTVNRISEFDAAQLGEYLSDKLEAYKVPRKIEITDMIEKTFNGKINRKAYR